MGRRAGRVIGIIGVVAGVLALALAGSGVASAELIKSYSWTCGSSRGATLHISVLDDRPAIFRADSGQEGEIPPGGFVDIPLDEPREGHLTVAPQGHAPGLIDKQSTVVCDARP